MNKVILIGNLGKDPEIRQSEKGVKFCTISLATQDGDKDENGNKKPSWHNLVAFDKTSDIFEKYTRKGSKVCVEGRIKYDEYVGKHGYKVTSTSITVYHVELLDKKNTSTDSNTAFSKQESLIKQEEQFSEDPFWGVKYDSKGFNR